MAILSASYSASRPIMSRLAGGGLVGLGIGRLPEYDTDRVAVRGELPNVSPFMVEER